VVGGAASLEVAPGKRLLDTPEFPPAYKVEASAAAAYLDMLKGVSDLDWSFLSPSALFVAGKRTAQFRLGTDQLLTGENGSRISYEDYAIALADEIETPRHIRQRFTVGY
jgi:putative NADH-flavin reductase